MSNPKSEGKIGLSLSFCVGDIIRGVVKEEDVKEIIAATNATTPEEWNSLIESYKKNYWHDNPREAEAVVRRFIGAGKIRQPRAEGKPYHNISEGHWIEANQLAEWEKSQEVRRRERR